MFIRTGAAVAGFAGCLLSPLLAHEGHEVPTAIQKRLTDYDAAFVAKDLDRLAGFYHPEVTIFEGGGTNHGWADYRDNHLGPELKEFGDLRFSHSNVVVHVLDKDERLAYVTAEYRLQTRVKDRDVDASGLATYVMLQQEGTWKIRHSHTSSHRRPAGSP